MTTSNWLLSLSPLSRAALLILLLTALALLQQTVSIGSENRLQIAINNGAHAPWFFLVTCLLWHITALLSQQPWRRRLLWVACGALLLATILEAAQFFTSRDADILDVGLNLLGATAALLVVLATKFWRQGQTRRSILLMLVAAIFLASGFTAAAEVLWVYNKRDDIAPELISLSQAGFPLRAMLRGDWELLDSNTDSIDAQSRHLLKANLDTERRWPGLILREPIPDWNDYEWLVLVAFTERGQGIPLEIRLETNGNRGMDSTVTVELSEDRTPLRIPLEGLGGDRFGELDKVRNLYLFSHRSETDRHFYLESLSLE